ncbi:hypothetical protein BU23DRAFT_579490 [Bimuria novae-zelandiae CBS 107.79]|uniref:Cyclin-like domain-containing protein n=1 Tax=Bimuria novae-zelandiae CBS 107.79 TaxID=1447943 RepID=A0A6A5VB70_9PLEO|nr:hypothetical protein BU23DRAFT_579490 [Bimuria novae-zelandiae CBS 107.79]
MPGPVTQRRRPPIPRLSDFDKPTPQPAQPPVPRPQYTCCDKPDVGDDEGENRMVCFNCGQIHANNDIVAEVSWTETPGGRNQASGGHVGHDQRHANSMGGAANGMRENNGGQTTLQRGKSAMLWICPKIGVNDETHPTFINATKWYQIALLHSFVQGRGILKVAAAAIYLASRKRRGNDVLLMDLAEAITVNVWKLGKVYRDLCKILMADGSSGHEQLDPIDIEPLMLKFCQKLEFDQDAYRVANDACVILRRMSRDWIVQGRNPAGLCGACIIQAARMNNFRRSVREVVYVCRVADTTINQRLYEFRRTQSAKLTVKQFREYAPKLKTNIKPPSIYRRLEREEKAAAKKRKLDALENGEPDDIVDDDDAGDGVEDGTPQPVPSKPTKRQEAMRKKQKANNGESVVAPSQSGASDQANGEGSEHMVVDIDALAGDDAEAGLDALANAETAAVRDEEAIIVPKRRGRPHKQRAPIIVTDEDIEVERELEAEILAHMKEMEELMKQINNDKGEHPKLFEAFETARKLVDLYKPGSTVNNEEEIGEDEFADDPDVACCLLSPEESEARERIWLVTNEEWLREQQKKMHAKALEEASGNQKKPKQKRRKQQMGDGSLLAGQPAISAADAAKRMLQKRAKHFSSHINYDVFKDIMPGASSSSEGTATPVEQAATPAPEQQAQPTYQAVPVGDGDDEEEEEYEEPLAEEEEDLEHQYLSDDDQGFDENENYDDY